MQRHDTTFGVTLHDNVTATLPNLVKSKVFERALNLGAGDMGQLRHAPAQEP